MYCVRVAVSQPVFGCSESTMKKPNKIRNLFKPNDKDKNNFFSIMILRNKLRMKVNSFFNRQNRT